VPTPLALDYVVLRIVPRVAREEFVNAGVILYAPTARFLGCRIALDPRRVLTLDAGADLAGIERHLEAVRAVCAGTEAAGELARLTAAERFQWLAAPRSTVIQPSAIRTGVCQDPNAALDELFAELVG